MSVNRTHNINELLHTPEGVRDLYGKEHSCKQQVTHKIHKQMHLYGYEDIQTPTFEFFDVFSKEIGTTPSRELYKFFDKEGNTLVLRPDFTPSVARCAAKYFMEDTVPIRFCYKGSAFSNTSNLQGKLKESTQMGAELINYGGAEADAELIAMLIESLLSTGLDKFQITVGNVEYFKGMCEAAGIDEETEILLREYISGKNLYAAEDLLKSRGMEKSAIRQLLRITEFISGKEELISVRNSAANERSKAAIDRLVGIYEILEMYGVADHVSFDLSLLSKYHYYTGVIFKGYTYGTGDAIATGGRYDSLLSYFGKEAPAIGFMIQIDALMEAIRRQKIDVALPADAKVITYTEDTYREALTEARELRKQGIKATLLPQK